MTARPIPATARCSRKRCGHRYSDHDQAQPDGARWHCRACHVKMDLYDFECVHDFRRKAAARSK